MLAPLFARDVQAATSALVSSNHLTCPFQPSSPPLPLAPLPTQREAKAPVMKVTTATTSSLARYAIKASCALELPIVGHVLQGRLSLLGANRVANLAPLENTRMRRLKRTARTALRDTSALPPHLPQSPAWRAQRIESMKGRSFAIRARTAPLEK